MAGRSVRCIIKVQSRARTDVGNGVAMQGETSDILWPECFRLADAQPRRQIDIDEFSIPGEWKAFLDRIYDHDEMAAGAARGNAFNRGRNKCWIGEKVADQNGLSPSRQAHSRGQLRRHVTGRSFLRQQNFSETFDDLSDREGGGEAKQSSAFAAAHEQISGCEAKHERAIDFWLQREPRSKPHGGERSIQMKTVCAASHSRSRT